MVSSDGGSVSSSPATLTVNSPFAGSIAFSGATYGVLNGSVGKEVLVRGCASRNGEANRYAASFIKLPDGTMITHSRAILAWISRQS